MTHGLTQEYLKRRLHYDPLTGEWTWKHTYSTRVKPGDPAGNIQTKGYRYIKIDGVSYIAARLAFLYMTGEWPEDEVDHDNRIPWDDRWDNLQPTSRAGNNLNRVKIGASGVPGVYRHSQNDCWVAQYKRFYLGTYDTIEAAAKARSEFITQQELTPTISDLERN